jgi:hypothetical protein
MSVSSSHKNGEGVDVEEITDLAMGLLSSEVFHMPREVHVPLAPPPPPPARFVLEDGNEDGDGDVGAVRYCRGYSTPLRTLPDFYFDGPDDLRLFTRTRRKKRLRILGPVKEGTRLWTSSLLDRASMPPKGKAGL